ncbi:hypothetical protein JF535_02960 [Microbulbifer salipaludis]|uniref:Uncharacterized protein n=1 Tax=Microbulbifer salipaludis TaxID=187980 RepID=A0ABS3E3E2_9GAMM|nr:hypothetical protein [Microbulbifer salipaludis]MBN8429806.1 hypothetical protein [Microbulbifer salipaludis]
MLQFDFHLQSWHANPNTGEATPSGKLPGKYNSLATHDLKGLRRLDQFNSEAFKSVRGRFFIFGGGSFVLMPLDYTPKYHLIYIRHPDRYEGYDTPYNLLSDENKRRLREQKAFIDSLPPEDPEKTILEKIWKNARRFLAPVKGPIFAKRRGRQLYNILEITPH